VVVNARSDMLATHREMLPPMSTFVIVHGAWGGGWEWSEVARLLREHGHDVFAPTLTGMGERAHLGVDEQVGMYTHVEDLVAVLQFENLRDVVLCGASYGGIPVTGAADQAADRIRQVIYVDALVPHSGQCALDLLPEGFGDMVRAGLEQHGSRWRVPMPVDLREALMPAGAIPERVRADYLVRIRDHPAAAFVEPVQLCGAIEQLPRAFVRCTTGNLAEELGGDPIEACATRAREAGWPYRELAAPHDPQVFNPIGIATLVGELAQQTV
jgi:pimeloyl-ACP methyl ester carboxylesterase